MSTIVVGPSRAATVTAKATISVRRGSWLPLRPPGFSSRWARAFSSRRATTSSIRLRTASSVAVIIVGWFSAALYWLVRRPGNRLGLCVLALAVSSVVDVAAGGDRSHAPQHRCVRRLRRRSFWPITSSSPSRRDVLRVAGCGAARGMCALQLYIVLSSALLLARRERRRADCRLQRCVSHERLHDRRPADDRRRASAGTFGRTDVRGLESASLALLIYRLATATRPRRRALIPVYVPGRDAHRCPSWSCTASSSGMSIWMRARSRSRLVAITVRRALFHTDLCFRSW